jgi:[ribosomal protein S18]-alanine N-acetyltransferase
MIDVVFRQATVTLQTAMLKKTFTICREFAYDCPHYGGDLMEKIILRDMIVDDLDRVLLIEAVSNPAPWNRDHFMAELGSSFSFPLVAISASADIAGFICLMQVIDEGEILELAVSPEFRGRGIGGRLVAGALSLFDSRGATHVSLEVRPSNIKAITLYSGCGFDIAGRRRAYYPDGEDALLMRLYMKNYQEAGHEL